ncbi:hypothetical protein AM493_07190 [Flavobacterium akiainvivens]|uniref:YcxB-like C-terminal domain-containing protein n=1 Tax=Flavobacterium akiainvivens TaxID=1202724 RepID=A0A0M9VHQ8_9FLAO|nr:YcxB family protein [Flavobacterium akiainvivens]KOS05846.1 hypothetical protein AM493_07190 [Flavobacterium akiainvivens]SFQ56846.1 hypothetical protein SAMN05444144_10881 [Flavobacterium akiainvivens]
MVTTKQFSLTPNNLLKALLSIYLKKRWWLLVLVWIWAAIVSSPDVQGGTPLIVIAVLYPVLIVYRIWRFANDKENAILYAARYYEMTESEITGYINDGSESRTILHTVIKYIELKHCYMLYVSKTQFIYIPKDCFGTLQDKLWFENKILASLKKW